MKIKYVIYTAMRYDPEVYFNCDSYKLESKLEKLAKQFNGEETGSGMGMGDRDINFEFKTISESKEFYKQARKIIPSLICDEIYINRGYETISTLDDLLECLGETE